MPLYHVSKNLVRMKKMLIDISSKAMGVWHSKLSIKELARILSRTKEKDMNVPTVIILVTMRVNAISFVLGALLLVANFQTNVLFFSNIKLLFQLIVRSAQNR